MVNIDYTDLPHLLGCPADNGLPHLWRLVVGEPSVVCNKCGKKGMRDLSEIERPTDLPESP